jgi:large subunit ribosomal protein L20
MPQFLNLKKGIIKMPRAKNKVAAHKRKKNILKQAKGYVGARSKLYTVAKNAVEKGLTHSYRDRKLKKRVYRNLWIVRINAAARISGVSYSQLMGALKVKNIDVNRKTLADLAYNNIDAFTEFVKVAMK